MDQGIEMGDQVEQRDLSRRVMPEIDRQRCVMCGDCVPSCPTGALTLEGDRLLLDEERCHYCGDCEDVCPVGAIALPYQVVWGRASDPSQQSEENGHG